MSCGKEEEEEFLENFFLALSQFNYDKAKEQAERERETAKQKGSIWVPFLTNLTQLAMAEKTYTSLLFLLPKGFLRKESSLRSMYEGIRSDLQTMDDFPKGAPVTSLDRLLVHISGQLVHFISGRVDMVGLYEHMSAIGMGKVVNYDELHEGISGIMQEYHKLFHHPLLTPLKSSFTLECESLLHMIEAQKEMQLWRFLPSLLALHDAHTKLASWAALFQSKEGRKFGSTFFKTNQQEALYQWHIRFKGALVSKFSLYFHSILSRQTSVPQIKTLFSRLSCDYYQKIVNFQHKHDAVAVTLVLDAHDLPDYRGFGYHHPLIPVKSPQGMESFPAIVAYPSKPTSHWPNLVMILSDSASELTAMEKPFLSFYDKQVDSTYFLARIEPRITLVLIFKYKHSEKEGVIVNFLTEMSLQLRCNRVLATLKNG